MVSESSQATGGRSRRLRLGMVGGGQGAFIGAVHRIAARLDDRYELVAGALASTPERSRASGLELGLDPARCYGSFAEMAPAERARPDGIDVVAIVTPNHVHYPAAKAFLEAGIHVVCDKPLTSSLGDARKLAELVERSGRVFVLTHNYTGYPMVRQARAMIEAGELGAVNPLQAAVKNSFAAMEAAGQGERYPAGAPTRPGAARPAAPATSPPTPSTSPAS